MVQLTILQGDKETILDVPQGANLRQILIEAGLSPYGQISKQVNCAGRGLCATCGVWFEGKHIPPPKHWHDKLAAQFGYPRLSCQITIDTELVVRLLEDKVMWGARDPNRQQPE